MDGWSSILAESLQKHSERCCLLCILPRAQSPGCPRPGERCFHSRPSDLLQLPPTLQCLPAFEEDVFPGTLLECLWSIPTRWKTLLRSSTDWTIQLKSVRDFQSPTVHAGLSFSCLSALLTTKQTLLVLAVRAVRT